MCLQCDEGADVRRVDAYPGRDGRVEPKVWSGLGLGLRTESLVRIRLRAESLCGEVCREIDGQIDDPTHLSICVGRG